MATADHGRSTGARLGFAALGVTALTISGLVAAGVTSGAAHHPYPRTLLTHDWGVAKTQPGASGGEDLLLRRPSTSP